LGQKLLCFPLHCERIDEKEVNGGAKEDGRQISHYVATKSIGWLAKSIPIGNEARRGAMLPQISQSMV